MSFLKVKNYNLNVTEVRDSDFKNAFPGIFNFSVGILIWAVLACLGMYVEFWAVDILSFRSKKWSELGMLIAKISVDIPRYATTVQMLPGAPWEYGYSGYNFPPELFNTKVLGLSLFSQIIFLVIATLRFRVKEDFPTSKHVTHRHFFCNLEYGDYSWWYVCLFSHYRINRYVWWRHHSSQTSIMILDLDDRTPGLRLLPD